MGRTRVELSQVVHAPRALVFDRLVDHEKMGSWPGIAHCHLVSEGSPRNGLGAVRLVKTHGLTLHEKIVYFDAPSGFDYKIIRGLPVDHLGTVRLEEQGSAVRIKWTVVMSSRVPLLAQIVGALLRRKLPAALAYVKRESERSAVE